MSADQKPSAPGKRPKGSRKGKHGPTGHDDPAVLSLIGRTEKELEEVLLRTREEASAIVEEARREGSGISADARRSGSTVVEEGLKTGMAEAEAEVKELSAASEAEARALRNRSNSRLDEAAAVILAAILPRGASGTGGRGGGEP